MRRVLVAVLLGAAVSSCGVRAQGEPEILRSPPPTPTATPSSTERPTVSPTPTPTPTPSASPTPSAANPTP